MAYHLGATHHALAPGRPLLEPPQAISAFGGLHFTTLPFELEASHLTTFTRRRRSTLVLVPEPQAPLKDLQQQLTDLCTWQDVQASTNREFRPHITLANQLTPVQMGRAKAALEQFQLNLRFTCTRVVLYSKQSNWPSWQPLAEHNL